VARMRTRTPLAMLGLAVLAALLLVPPVVSGAATSGHRARSLGTGTTAGIQKVGTVSVRQLAAARAAVAGGSGATNPDKEIGPWLHLESGEGEAGAAPVDPPTPGDTPVVFNENRHGWEGLNHTAQRQAGGGNQFSLEPPDQGLCVGNVSPNDPSFGPEVVESVNDALIFYDGVGEQFTPAITLSSFYGLPPTINRSTGAFGPFISDPKCYFDPDTQRWFHTVLVITQDPKTGNFMRPAYVYIAVSTSSEALGSYYIYRINATDTKHPNCPCFGDQPLIGADQYGFYVSTAEYDLKPFGGNFNGPQIYAMSKTGLESGTLPIVKHFDGLTHINGGRTTGTVQPATAPDGTYDSGNNGTEYFLSGYDCDPTAACAVVAGPGDKITIWGMTNTASLNAAHPHPHLSLQDLDVGTYENPVPQHQQDGFRPLGTLVGEPNPVINANDARMNQVVFADGLLWSGINTSVDPGPRDGIEYFIVEPSIVSGLVNGAIHNEGYVAAAGTFLSFPSIGVNGGGQGVIAMTLMGPDNYPSAAQIAIDQTGTLGSVEVTRTGFRPEDGFTCYDAFVGTGNGICRWGDYSASVATPDGTIWSATEMISDNTRTFFGNWSTFVWPVETVA
jgi:hypothetical protein